MSTLLLRGDDGFCSFDQQLNLTQAVGPSFDIDLFHISPQLDSLMREEQASRFSLLRPSKSLSCNLFPINSVSSLLGFVFLGDDFSYVQLKPLRTAFVTETKLYENNFHKAKRRIMRNTNCMIKPKFQIFLYYICSLNTKTHA